MAAPATAESAAPAVSRPRRRLRLVSVLDEVYARLARGGAGGARRVASSKAAAAAAAKHQQRRKLAQAFVVVVVAAPSRTHLLHRRPVLISFPVLASAPRVYLDSFRYSERNDFAGIFCFLLRALARAAGGEKKEKGEKQF